MDIIHTHHPDSAVILTTPSTAVEFPLTEPDQVVLETLKTMVQKLEGVGLAAPQVGVSKKMIVIYIPEVAAKIRHNASGPVPLHALLNPHYQPDEGAVLYTDWEGCYSVKDEMGKVARFDKIILTYQDEFGNRIIKKVEGFYARVLQHEIDHVEGKTILDRFRPEDPHGPMEQMMPLREAELSPEAREILEYYRKKRALQAELEK